VKTNTPLKPVGLRMEPDLLAKAKERAESQRRSLTGHIIWLIEQDLRQQGNVDALTTQSAPFVISAQTEPTLKAAEDAAKYKAKRRM
jgi:hypothetical protein